MTQKLNFIVGFLLFIVCNSTLSGQSQIGEKLEIFEPFSSYALSVSSSESGERVAVGAYGKSDWGFRVYEFDGTNWVQLGNDVSTIHPNDISIYEVALSADGTRIAVGELINARPDFGVVRIFDFDGNYWNQIGNDLFGESNGDFFGSRISLSSNGNRLIVGAKFNNNSIGNARVFEYNGSNWTQLGDDIDGDNDQFYFAESVSISHNGMYVAIGSNQFDINNQSNVGLTRIFEYDGTNWIQLGDDLVGAGVSDSFGVRISLSHDGNRIAIGATGGEGYVKVFDFDGLNWGQVGETLYGDVVGDRFGRMVSLSGIGNRLAIGSPSKQNGNRPGLVKFYEFNNSDWIQLGENIEGDVVSDEFGKTLSLSKDGSTLISGALTYVYPQSGTEQGFAKVFDLSDLVLSIHEYIKNEIVIYPNPTRATIQLRNSLDIKELFIFDSTGNLIKEAINVDEKIELLNLQNGIYFVKIITVQNKTKHIKLIKY